MAREAKQDQIAEEIKNQEAVRVQISKQNATGQVGAAAIEKAAKMEMTAKLEKERLEKERPEREKLEREKLEKERLKNEAEWLEREKEDYRKRSF